MDLCGGNSVRWHSSAFKGVDKKEKLVMVSEIVMGMITAKGDWENDLLQKFQGMNNVQIVT